MIKRIPAFFVLLLLLTFTTTTALIPAANAAVIDTSAYLQKTEGVNKTALSDMLAREDVREQLIAYGVDPDDAAQRIAAMTEDELRMIQGNIDNLPAGSDVLAVLGIVLIVLIVLELIGVTNVFNKL